jgi:Ca2+-dependent lipid-binding protein
MSANAKAHNVVHEAFGITGKDGNGLSDPYCIVSFNKHIRKTKVMFRNLNPKWEERFIL